MKRWGLRMISKVRLHIQSVVYKPASTNFTFPKIAKFVFNSKLTVRLSISNIFKIKTHRILCLSAENEMAHLVSRPPANTIHGTMNIW